MKKNRFQELDALRGIAALLVVFFHFTIGRIEANYGFKVGVTGVDLFFIISGFVIYMSLNSINSGKEFIINRISRLYPTYWAAVIFTFSLLTIQTLIINHGAIVKFFEIGMTNWSPINFSRFVVNLTMFQYYLGFTDLDPPYWTLHIELFFYFFILLLFVLKWLKYINTIGICINIIAIIITFFVNDASKLNNALSYAFPLLKFFPLFFSGIIFYKIYTKNIYLNYGYFLIIFCFVCQSMLFNHAGISHIYIHYWEYSIMLLLYFTTFILFVNNKLHFIICKPTLFLGKISYALYLIHQTISLNFLLPIFILKHHLNFWIVVFFIDLPIIILLSYLITSFIEIPLGKKMKTGLKHYFLYRNDSSLLITSQK